MPDLNGPDNPDKDGDCTSCTVNSAADLTAGALSQEIKISGVRTLGVSRDLTLQYRSTHADVRPILPVITTLDVRAAVPNTFSADFTVGGLAQGTRGYWNASVMDESATSSARLGLQFDATSLKTGRYPYELMLFSNYGQSSIGGASQRDIVIRNEQTSVWGAGWTLAGLDRLLVQSNGALVLAQGNGTTEVFRPVSRPLVIESLSVARSIVIGGQSLSVVAGGVYTQARADLLASANFGPAGIVSRAVTFRTGVDTITPEALAGVDIFIVSLPLTELTQSETVALEQFVQEGGALLETRNLYARPPLLGTVPGPLATGNTAPYTMEGLNSVLVQGPFGTAANPVGTGFNYSFAVTGVGTVLATNGAGPNLLLFPPATIVTGRGRAVLLGDEEPFASGFTSGGANFYNANKILFLNTIAYLAGAPGFRTPPPPPSTTPIYQGPPGDFSTVVKHLDGAYTRTMKDGTIYHFTAQGLQISMRDRNSNTTTYVYDGNGNLTTITDPAGQVTTLTYNGTHIGTITDSAGRVTALQYDGAGNLSRVVWADATQTVFEYDPQHRLTKKTDARGKVSHYRYDDAGRFDRGTMPTGEFRELSPSQKISVPNLAAGQGTAANPATLTRNTVNRASFTDAKANTTTFELDAIGRVTKQIDPLNRTTTITRDSQGNPLVITRPNGAITTMTYDAKGNLLTSTEQAIAATTAFVYEPTFNQVTRITDPKGNQTTITYDVKGSPLTITDADNKVTTFTYNAQGLLSRPKTR